MEKEQIVSSSGINIHILVAIIIQTIFISLFILSQSWGRVFDEDASWSAVSSEKTESDVSIENTPLSTDQITPNDFKNVDLATIRSHINVHSLIKSYQQRGHFAADLDPLGITTIDVIDEHGVKRRADESVTKNYFNFSASDMDREFFLPPSTFIAGSRKTLKLRFVALIFRRVQYVDLFHFSAEKLSKVWKRFIAIKLELNICTIKITLRFIGFESNLKRRKMASLQMMRRN